MKDELFKYRDHFSWQVQIFLFKLQSLATSSFSNACPKSPNHFQTNPKTKRRANLCTTYSYTSTTVKGRDRYNIINKMIKFVLSFCLLALCTLSYADKQAEMLFRTLKSKLSKNHPNLDSWAQLDDTTDYSPVYVGPQDGLAQLDKILALPGQPEGVDFDQYSGYVNIDPKTEKALFYYFVESPQNSSTNPLVLWLNGGPGCSSLIGGLAELGPFRVNSDGNTLFRNKYAWNNVANVLFLESPAGVGFSYANMTSVYNNTGDKSTADDAYTFLVNWLERFPQYKNRDFYITGESYAGHYVPQLAYTILQNNKKSNQTIINLKGIAIGNALIEHLTRTYGFIDYFWTHAMNSDETHDGLLKYCNFSSDSSNEKCDDFFQKFWDELGEIDVYNIYAPTCDPQAKNGSTPGSVESFDPCWESILVSYLNKTEVQTAFHAKPTNWDSCSDVIGNWTDRPSTILPIIEYLIANGQRLWVYSGDIDGVVPVTASRYSINALKLPIETAWRPWYSNKQVGGYVVGYKGLVLTTVRGAGHTVPSYQPERALTMFSSLLQGTLPPPS